MKLRTTNPLLLVAVLAAGCGGTSGSNDEAKPTLDPAVASRLASASDAIAEALDAGDVCTAAGRADDLKDAVLEAINAGEVPPEFQEELTGRANELVNEVNCPPPPTTTDEDDEKGKGKGHKKKDRQVVTVPTDAVVTEPTPIDTTGGAAQG